MKQLGKGNIRTPARGPLLKNVFARKILFNNWTGKENKANKAKYSFLNPLESSSKSVILSAAANPTLQSNKTMANCLISSNKELVQALFRRKKGKTNVVLTQV